jgi:hypothetical protein
MKANLAILVLSLSILLLACGKDKFETKPRLEIKDYSGKEIEQGEILKIRLNYFDKEGDIRDRVNVFVLPPAQDKADTFRYNLPEFPDNVNGEITFQLDYDFLKESITENDTLVFRFAVSDKMGNTSDTISSEKIVIRLP